MMIEILLKNYLEKILKISVIMELAEITDKKHVVIQKTGSRVKNHIKKSTFAIQSYGESLYEAAKLNEEVKAAMENFITEQEISKIELDTDYYFPSIETKQYRYQAVFEITYY